MTRLALLLMMIFFAAGISAQHAPSLKKKILRLFGIGLLLTRTAPPTWRMCAEFGSRSCTESQLRNESTVPKRYRLSLPL